AVYIQEQGHDACGRTAWQRPGAERLAGSHESVASWRPLGEHRYAWDKSGRLTGHEMWSKTRSEQETRYRYDNRDQITSVLRLNADGPAQEERYRYTVNEQIAESRINGILSQHDYRNECVTQAGDSRYEYDTCGRVIKRTEQKRGFRPQEWRYRWDDFDRLREVKTPDGEVWQYRYDAFGRRTAKRNIIRAAWKQNHHTVSEVRYQWLGMALSASEKRYADGTLSDAERRSVILSVRRGNKITTPSARCATSGWGWRCRRVRSATRTAARRCVSSGITGAVLSCWRRRRGRRTTTPATFIPYSSARMARRRRCTAQTGERCGGGSEACGGWRRRITCRLTHVKAVTRALWASGRTRRAGCGIIYTATIMPGSVSI
ncbi:hypothetical protein M1754_11200, partial [Salmonella enterica subsp. enterica serovar Montevideo]|uniref:RHS repeat domain-containing protein n=1 Tax=Salmonella enterica TaxID=28901 RepID=UPI002A430029|nr:hypothetical protein [Salmonella enterica subsp. enterica serovar Montevideo]